MKVRMIVPISGGRGDGTDWPGPGGIVEVDDEEGRHLCQARLAVPVITDAAEIPERPDAAIEVRAAPGAAETAPEDLAAAAPAPPRVNAPRADWAAHAISRGADPDAVDEMTKAALIARYGKTAQG